MLKENAEVKVNYIKFFKPIRPYYGMMVMRNNFGLGKEGGVGPTDSRQQPGGME